MTDLPLHPGAFRDVAAVARHLTVSCETVRAWIRAGKLDAIHTPTGHYRIPITEITRILKRRAQEAQDTHDAQKEQETQEAQTNRRKRRKQAQARK